MHEAVPPTRNGTAYIGFCGSTGDALASMQILSFRFAALEQVGALYSFGQGTFGSLGLGHRRPALEPNLVTALDGIALSSVAVGQYIYIYIHIDM